MLLYPTVVLVLEREFAMSYGELLALLTVSNVLFGVRGAARRLARRPLEHGGYDGGVFHRARGSLHTHRSHVVAVGLALIGLFASIYHPVGMAWLVRSAVNRGKVLGITGIFGSGGGAVRRSDSRASDRSDQLACCFHHSRRHCGGHRTARG